MGRRTLLLIASILVAALGTALIWLYVQGADTRAQSDTAMVSVLVSTVEAGPGPTVADLKPTSVQVPSTVAANAVRSLQDVGDQRLKYGVTIGQPLMRNMFDNQTQSFVPRGKAYVTISVTDEHRGQALLHVKDRVAVYALGNKQSTFHLIDGDVVVQSIGQETSAGPGNVTAGQIVGFFVDPGQIKDFLDIQASGEQPAIVILGAGTAVPSVGP